MSQTYYKIWIHLIWATKVRRPLMQKEARQKILNHIKEKAGKEGYYLDTINGVADHLHCLISLSPRFSISEVMNKLKGESSHWINSEKITRIRFAWQGGFAAFSVSASQVHKVRNYIRNQEKHHQKISFEAEVGKFLKLYDAERE
jgi:REP element-mobilizing transposase RayT